MAKGNSRPQANPSLPGKMFIVTECVCAYVYRIEDCAYFDC